MSAHVCVRACAHAHMYACVCVCAYVSVYVHVCRCVHTSMCLWARMCVTCVSIALVRICAQRSAREVSAQRLEISLDDAELESLWGLLEASPFFGIAESGVQAQTEPGGLQCVAGSYRHECCSEKLG